MTALLVLLPLAGLLAYAVLVRAQRRVAQRIEHTTAVSRASAAGAVDVATHDPTEAPPIVRRYLELVLPPDSAAPAFLVLQQHGELRTSPTATRWLPFTASHTVNPSARRFLWNARIAAAPLVHLRVLDGLTAGRGSGQVWLLSALDVGHDGGTPEMNAGSLHRFLAEAVWYPWALRPSEHLRWTTLDAHRAVATLTADGTTVALEFRFAESGEVTGIYTPARWGSFGGHYAPCAWEGHFSAYERCEGVLLPRAGEVGWYHEGRLELVWRGRIDRVSMHGHPASPPEIAPGQPGATTVASATRAGTGDPG